MFNKFLTIRKKHCDLKNKKFIAFASITKTDEVNKEEFLK